MKQRDAQRTQQQILEAATAEFAQHGIAGARVDRIAEAAGGSKAMIYAYFGSKDGLFDAVFGALVARNLHEVPLDVHDLPEYAARQFDQHQRHPEVLRLSTWDQLERAGKGATAESVVAAFDHKVGTLRAAQERGVVSNRFPARTLLELILALTQMRATTGEEHPHARRRQAIKEAVKALLDA